MWHSFACLSLFLLCGSCRVFHYTSRVSFFIFFCGFCAFLMIIAILTVAWRLFLFVNICGCI